MPGRLDFWLALLVASIVISLPTNVHLSIFAGLLNVRPWQPVLLATVAAVLVSYRAGHWRFSDVVAWCLLVMAAAILARSIVRLFMEVEPHFRILSDWTGAPAWEGATKTKGVVTSLLLCAYVIVAILVAGLTRHPAFGSRILGRAAAVLMWSVAAYAAVFLALLAISLAFHGRDTASWLITVRGIDVGHFRKHPAVAFFGPVEGLTFASGAALAAARAFSSAPRGPIAIAAAAIQALAATFTFSRGAWLGLLIGLLALLVLAIGLKPKSIAIALALVVGLGLLTAAFMGIVRSHEPTIASRLFSLVGSTSGARLEDWRSMLLAFFRAPLFGLGAEAYRPLTLGYPAENFWLEIAFSGGLFALVPLVFAHAKIIQLFGTARLTLTSGDSWLLPLFIAFVVFLSGTFSNTAGWSPIYWLLLGLTLGGMRQVLAAAGSRAAMIDLPRPTARDRSVPN